MGYIEFERQSDGAHIRLALGKVKGIVYSSNGQPNWNLSNPYIEYYGDSVKKLINTAVKTDTLYMLNAEGSRGLSCAVTSQEFNQLLTGQYKNDVITGAIVKNVKGITYSIKLFNYSATYTNSESLGVYDTAKNTIQVMFEFDGMLVYDYENQYMYLHTQDELLYTGGAFAPDVPAGTAYTVQAIPSKYGCGIRRFSKIPPKTTNNGGGKLKIQNGTLQGNPIYLTDQYVNDNRMSSIGSTAKSSLCYRNTGGTFLNRVTLIQMQKVLLTQITDPVDNDEHVNPNEDDDGDEEGNEGKQGDGDDSTDPIPRPPVPDLEITQSIIKMFELTPTQLRDLSTNLWSKDIFQQLYNVLSTPIDAIISLYMIMCGNIPTTAEEYIYFGNIESLVKGKPISNSHIIMKSSNIYVPLYYGNYHDYTTKVKIFLPYCGFISLPNFVLGNTLNVQYDIDLVSGNALITIASFIQNTEVIIDRRTVNMGYRIPLSGKDSAQYVGAVWHNPISVLTDDSQIQASSIEGNAQYFDVPYPYLLIERTDLAIPSNYPNVNGAPAEYYASISTLTGYTKIKEIQINIANCTDVEQQMIRKLLVEDGVII